MLSMIGADPLGTPDKHSFFYWLIIGRVSSFRGLKLSSKRWMLIFIIKKIYGFNNCSNI